jgi:hypothetical protein
VIHAFGVLACQAVMAAHHGKRHHCGAVKKGGIRRENAAEGIMAEFEPPEEVAVLENSASDRAHSDDHPSDLFLGSCAGSALAAGPIIELQANACRTGLDHHLIAWTLPQKDRC